MSRTVVLVDAVRTPFGKSGGMYAGTRADDLIVRAIRGLLDRNPLVDHSAIDAVLFFVAFVYPRFVKLFNLINIFTKLPFTIYRTALLG